MKYNRHDGNGQTQSMHIANDVGIIKHAEGQNREQIV